ncbi:MAG: alpha/beta hydrolase, partial [Burkholderiaceae bacterium]|nr:alpha/beta hydrolase [Burkholderiaceae bacterium]
NTSLRPFSAFYQRLRPANYAALLRLAALGGTPAQWEKTILRLTSQPANEGILAHWLALRRERPVSRLNALRQLIAAARYRASLIRPPVPTLVLASARDRLVSVECSLALARQWQCALRVHPGAGHDLPLDDGPWVAQQVCDWLPG